MRRVFPNAALGFLILFGAPPAREAAKMPTQTIYRQQFSRAFEQHAYVQTYNSGIGSYDPDAFPVTMRPETYLGKEVRGLESGGPGGLGYLTKSDAGDWQDAGIVLMGIGGDDPQKYMYDWGFGPIAAFDGRGVTYEWWQKFSTAAAGANAYSYVLALTKGVYAYDRAFYVAVDHGYSPHHWDFYRSVGAGAAQSPLHPAYVADDQWHRMSLRVEPGTITGDPWDVWSAAADGWWKITVDGATLAEESGLALSLQSSVIGLGGHPYLLLGAWIGFYGMLGEVADLHIFRATPDAGQAAGCPTDTSADKYHALPPWIRSCEGGGVVPLAGDVQDSESWS